MLTRLNVQGYKALRDIETTLEPLTVLVGPNGCGKTSVLEAIAMVRDFAARRHREEVLEEKYPPQELLTKEPALVSSASIGLVTRLSEEERESIQQLIAQKKAEHLGTEQGPNRFQRLLEGFPFEQGGAIEEVQEDELAFQLYCSADAGRWDTIMRSSWRFGDVRDEHALFRRCFGRMRLLELDVKTIARPSYSREIVPRIGNDGHGLATVLAWLQGERPEEFEAIQMHLREFVPEVERVRLRRAPVRIADIEALPVGHDESGKAIYTTHSVQREEIGSEILLDFRHAKGVPAKHVSEGTLLLLGLLTIVHTGNVSVLLLDDVDRALHPKAQQQLVAYLRTLTEQGIQIIATSHSPYLVLHLEYDEVRIVTSSETGGALIGKLTDHPEYERWHEDMTPSEFWTVFGEDWLMKVKGDG